MRQTLLELKGVHKHYPGVHALRGVDLEIREGEVHGLIGENGSGKSTLIKVMTGVVQPDPGATILLKGRALTSLDAAQCLRNGISVIFQHFSLFENLTVAENIVTNKLIEQRAFFVGRGWIWRSASQALDRLGAELDLGMELGLLPIAKRQQVAIARAILCDTRLLVMDEPTSALSSEEISGLFTIIRNLRDRGISVLFVSHKLDEVLAICDRITILRDGQLVGETIENSDSVTIETLASLMIGKRLLTQRFNFSSSGKMLLEARNLTKKGNFRDISFSLREREVLGITGLMGSGKTELALALFGVNRHYDGELILDGRPVKIFSPTHAKSLGIGYISEERQTKSLILKKSVKSNIVITVITALLNRIGLLKDHAAQSIARDWIQRLAIKCPSMDTEVEHLSGGNQQRVVISKWLATNPRVLILDNPTAGIDISAKKEITDIIFQLAQQGLGIIYISEEIPDVISHCSRIIVMKKGRFIQEFDAKTVTEEEVMKCQYA
jgi:ABC-type sugar transport system ATPase subunit